ncbi:GFA family protein [Aspergillus lucknowensis]|uniref:Mss4-like protein n=1 Tax=Aspergillus lucknowensis TaxID=176173 RepID=A0ABR4LJY7_9EURO
MPSGNTVVGGCYCGKVRYETTGPVYGLTLCYCRMCQLVHGAPFATYTNIQREHLKWIRRDALTEFSLSKYATRTACRECHAPISMTYHVKPHEVGLCAVTINEKESAMTLPEVQRHIFVQEKPAWYTISDDAPQAMGVPESSKSYMPEEL